MYEVRPKIDATLITIIFNFFAPSHFYYLRLSFLSLLVVTQIRGHIIAGSLPPYPLRFVPCIFIARRFQLFLPSSTRVELCLLTHTLGALSSWSFFIIIFANKFKISPRRDSNSQTNTATCSGSIRGLPLLIVHRGDRLKPSNYDAKPWFLALDRTKVQINVHAVYERPWNFAHTHTCLMCPGRAFKIFLFRWKNVASLKTQI